MAERRNSRIADVLRLDPIERISLLLSLGTCGAALAFASPRFAEAVAVGAVIEAFNLRVLVRAARSFLASNAEAGAGGGFPRSSSGLGSRRLRSGLQFDTVPTREESSWACSSRFRLF